MSAPKAPEPLKPLNYLELKRWTELNPISCNFVSKVLIPERKSHPQGAFKFEWALELSGGTRSETLVFSVRPRFPTLTFHLGHPFRTAKLADSSFGQMLKSHAPGRKLTELSALDGERAVFIGLGENLAIVLFMIPATPEALLVEASSSKAPGPWKVLSRTRANLGNDAGANQFSLQIGRVPPPGLSVRADLDQAYTRYVERLLDIEALSLRHSQIKKLWNERVKDLTSRIGDSQRSVTQAEGEADYERLGNLLKGLLSDPRYKGVMAERIAMDYETGEPVTIAGDPKLDCKTQMERFFNLARRKVRRLGEAQSRGDALSAQLSKLKEIKVDPQDLNEVTLAELEEKLGITREPGTKKNTSRTRWQGRTFRSVEGSEIWVGKTRDENLDLTLRHAKGNDTWLHLRGRPGAHVVVPSRAGKSVSLETLLDAAHLCIHFSGGREWGKTEVDYTLRKNVKRIKGSTEVQYAQNKTLTITPDAARLSRLLGREE
jgi:predicted ribosome quality control (RQC) complex YloA/Tae2 family protein